VSETSWDIHARENLFTLASCFNKNVGKPNNKQKSDYSYVMDEIIHFTVNFYNLFLFIVHGFKTAVVGKMLKYVIRVGSLSLLPNYLLAQAITTHFSHLIHK
jgi:hypothetical protein